MNKQNTLSVLGYQVFNSSLDRVDFNKKTLINTFSPNSYGIALKDKEFETALKNTDILVLDGMGIALGSILLHGKNIRKIAGQDCFDYFIAQAEKNRWKIFFLGSSQATLEKIYNRVHKEYPHVEVGGYSPPFKPVFTSEDNQVMIKEINAFDPHVLFVGMTAPKQEKWAYQNYHFVNAQITSTIGNVFDWYAGNSKRPGKIWIALRLEWLVRIFHRPEIFRRNTKNQLLFFRDLILVLFKIKKI